MVARVVALRVPVYGLCEEEGAPVRETPDYTVVFQDCEGGAAGDTGGRGDGVVSYEAER